MISAIFSMWFKPRKGVQYLQEAPFSQIWIMLGLCILYLIQVGAFLLSIEDYSLSFLLTYKGFLLLVYASLFLGVAAFVVVQASSLSIWLGARCIGGRGTLPQTRAAVVWTFTGSIPIGFFWVLLYCAFRFRDILGKAAAILGAFSYVGVLATVIYMFTLLLITVSETHQMGRLRAFVTIVFGMLIFVLMGYALLQVYKLYPP